ARPSGPILPTTTERPTFSSTRTPLRRPAYVRCISPAASARVHCRRPATPSPPDRNVALRNSHGRSGVTTTFLQCGGDRLLQDAISYAENRINLVDGKAALMLTAVTALFASLVFAAGDLPKVTSLWSASALV